MEKRYTFHYFSVLVFGILGLLPFHVFGQLDADLSSTENTNCDGSPCDYDGPSILINELMMSPDSHDGSMWGSNSDQRGEWIELYNPNICEPIDISCFYLGNNAKDSGSPYPGGYVIPSGTVVPPAGFAMIRGLNAPAVPAELLVENGGNVVELIVNGDGVCLGGGSRLWFPNVGGWFAFYDNNGVPQDAVSWGNQDNLDEYPCVPTLTGCGFSGSLANYNEFPNDRKSFILSSSAKDHQGMSIRRIPDGGTWDGPGTPTYAICNSECVNPQFINCNGTATAIPQDGTPPYTYLWNDSRTQTTQTADQLCAGEYCVTITDDLGNSVVQCVTVDDVSYDFNISDAICAGENYTLPDNSVVDEAGEYPVLLHTGHGCDSLITVSLELYPTYKLELNPQICTNHTYTLPDGTEVTQSGTYVVDFQTIHGCDSIYTVNLTVSDPIQIAVNVNICQGDTYTLPDNSEVSTEGHYEVLVAGDPTSCDTLFSVNLAFYPAFGIDVDEFKNISCFGENDGSVSLDISGSGIPYTYAWSDSLNHGAQATDLKPGDYLVEITDVNGCKADTSFQIEEPSLVSITASADNLICLGSQSELLAEANGGTGDFTYYWDYVASSDPITSVNPSSDTTYTVYAADENGCKTDTVLLDVAVISMNVDSLEIIPGDSICAGGETSIATNYHGFYPPYTYTWSHGLPDGPGPFTVSPDQTTIYTVTVSDDCGNVVLKEIPVVVRALPVAEIDSIANVSCFGLGDGMANISVSEGSPDYVFVWSDGQDHGANSHDLIPGSYEVQISDIHGCETEISFDIAEPLPLDITLSGDTLICPGEETQLTALASGGTNTLSYHWGHTTADSDIVLVNPDENSTYSVYAEDGNGCTTDPLEIAITVMKMDMGLLTISNDTSVCPGQSASIFGSYSGNYPPYNYQWSEGLGTGEGPYLVSPSESVSYALTVSDICANELTANVDVHLFENPEVVLPDDLLSGCSPFEINLFDPINTASGYLHQWQIENAESYFGNPVNFSLDVPGIYQLSLSVTSPEGCTAKSGNTIPLEVYDIPSASFSASPWSTGIDEPEISFIDLSSGSVFSLWNIENNFFENQNEVNYSFPDTGRYAVQLLVENEFGCRDSVTHWVTITIDHNVDIPNAFVPNPLGDNPYYDPKSTSNTVFYPFSEYVIDYQMSVFNRWGELIFESTEKEKGWNGTYHDKPCPQDVYVYKVELEFADGKRVTKVGDVTLFR